MKVLKNKFALVIVFALVVAMILPVNVFADGDAPTAGAGPWTVTFVTGVGPAVDPVQVNDGGLVSADHVPSYEEMDSVEGYAFWGWYKDEECTEEFEFEEDAITEDTNIYACYKKLHTITFVSNVELGDEYDEELEGWLIPDGMFMWPPEVPSEIWGEDDDDEDLPLYVFDGMFLDEAFTQRLAPDMPITEDTTVYLHYKPIRGNEVLDEINVTIANPVVGESTDTPIIETEGDAPDIYVWSKQTGILDITIPEGEHWHTYNGDLGGGFMYGMYLPIEVLPQGIFGPDSEYSISDLTSHLYMQIVIITENETEGQDGSYTYNTYTPFIGTFEKGEIYDVYVWLQADDGYDFNVEGLKIVVNGVEIEEEDIMNIQPGQVEFIAHLPAITVYHILDGDGLVHTIGVDGDESFRADGELEDLTAVLLDNEELDINNPEVAEVTVGSTIVTLKQAFLDTLEIGEHILTFVYNDGQVSATFTVKEPDAVQGETNDVKGAETITPNTGDEIKIYIALLMSACVGMIIISKKARKI